MNFSLQGKAAIVTGASKGIGKAIAVAFAQASARLTVSSCSLEAVEQGAQEIQDSGGEALAAEAHMGQAAQVEALAARSLESRRSPPQPSWSRQLPGRWRTTGS